MFNKKRRQKTDENAKQIADLKRRLEEVSATAEATAKAQAEEPSVDELLDRAIEAELKTSANELGERIAKADDVVPARDAVAHAAAVLAGESVEEVKRRWAAEKKEPPRKIGTKPATVKVKKIVPPRTQTNAKRGDLKYRKTIVNGERRSLKPAHTGQLSLGDQVRHPNGKIGVVAYVVRSEKVDIRTGQKSVRVFVTSGTPPRAANKTNASGRQTRQRSDENGESMIQCIEYTLRFNDLYVLKGDHPNQSTFLRSM